MNIDNIKAIIAKTKIDYEKVVSDKLCQGVVSDKLCQGLIFIS